MASKRSGQNGMGKVATRTNGALGHLFGESTRKTGLDADWMAVSPEIVLRMVWAIDYLGGSVTLGSTRKGNAYSVKVYIGAPYDPVYFDGDDEGRAEMAAWVEKLVEAAAETA